MSGMAEEVRRLRAELDQLATCANLVCDAARSTEDFWRDIQGFYGLQGMEFSVMRAAWLLGEVAEAERIHALIGDHGGGGCPICSGDSAFAAWDSGRAGRG